MTKTTRRKEQHDRAIAWRDAAVADGWSIEPTYQTEDVNRAAKLHKDGFVVQIITRYTPEGRNPGYEYEGKVSVWGPDGLAVMPGRTYNWDYLQAGLRRCNYCKSEDVDTERVSFAGRCCATCLPKKREQLEYAGWTR